MIYIIYLIHLLVEYQHTNWKDTSAQSSDKNHDNAMQMYPKMRPGFRDGKMNFQHFRDTRSSQIQFMDMGSRTVFNLFVFFFSVFSHGWWRCYIPNVFRGRKVKVKMLEFMQSFCSLATVMGDFSIDEGSKLYIDIVKGPWETASKWYWDYGM